MKTTLVFDLGGVLIDIDWQCTFRCLQSYCRDKSKSIEALLPYSEQYERGEIKSYSFFETFRKLYNAKISFGDFERCWNAMIFNFPYYRLEMLQELKQKYGLILLSNINDLHYKYVMQKFARYFEVFDKAYFSHFVGMRKPEKRIFEKLIKENSLNPGEIIYFDDTEIHLQTAAGLGIQTVLVEQEIVQVVAGLNL